VVLLRKSNPQSHLAVTEQATSYPKFVEFAVEKTGLKY
jgi:hypothetical protein